MWKLVNHCCPGKTLRAQLVNEPMGQFFNERQTANYKQQTEFQQLPGFILSLFTTEEPKLRDRQR